VANLPGADGLCLNGKGVNAAGKLGCQRLIHHTVHLDARLAGKGFALDADAEMRLDATGVDTRMPAVLIRFIDHFEPNRLERRCQYVGDSIASHHAKQSSSPQRLRKDIEKQMNLAATMPC
jgi:hypothetical protein